MARTCHSVSLVGYWASAAAALRLGYNDQWDVLPHSLSRLSFRRQSVISTIRQLWVEEQGQDVAEYAVMLAVILVLVVGTIA